MDLYFDPVGASLLAKAVYLAEICGECTGLFASKLAPTGSRRVGHIASAAANKKRGL